MYRTLMILTFLLAFGRAEGQIFTGVVRIQSDSAGNIKGIPGISVYFKESHLFYTTDQNGYFNYSDMHRKVTLIARFESGDSMVQEINTTLNDTAFITRQVRQIGAVNISVSQSGSQIHSKGIQKIEILNEGEFKKAACCTLSESFETNNTVEVSNSDGVSGIRQVEMLGLAGKYVLMTRDNMPVIRGLNVLTGLNHIPGPMVGGVHIAKGSGSVTNGFEGITGGINYALKTNPKDPRVFVNGYTNSQTRNEGNIILKQSLNKSTFNHLYLHYGAQFKAFDKGGDGYTDLPVYQRISIGDQLNYYGKKSEGIFGITHVREQRDGGDIRYFRGEKSNDILHFSMNEIHTEAFAKIGIFLNKDGSSSIGNIFYLNQTKSDAVLNNLINRKYSGSQNTLSYTGLYGSPVEKKWSVKTGINVMLDDVSENFSDSFVSFQPKRKEYDAGAFGEVVHKGERLHTVLGMRMDYNNIYGWIFTPRLHMKFDIASNQQVHMQIGMGRRTPWIFAENLPYLINNRQLIINAANVNSIANGAYGMPQEKAWNGGLSYTRHFVFMRFPSTLSADFFYTYFLNQNTVDRDANPEHVMIHSNSGNFTFLGQAEWLVKPHRRLDIKLSYRYVNSRMMLGNVLQLQPQQAPHRGLIVLNYSTRKKWLFDLITQINSPKRLPLTAELAEKSALQVHSPWYTIINLQIRKEIKSWELYTGCENVLNVIQKNTVINVQYGGKSIFDAGYAWGPTLGRNFVFGFRYSFK